MSITSIDNITKIVKPKSGVGQGVGQGGGQVRASSIKTKSFDQMDGEGESNKEQSQAGQGQGQGKPGEGQGQSQGQGGGEGTKETPIERRMPTAGPGEVTTKQHGDEIMRRNGYDPSSGQNNTAESWSKSATSAAKEAQSKLSKRSQMAGTGGNGSIYQRIIDMHTPKVDWQAELADLVGTIISEYNFKPWNRRSIGGGNYRYAIKNETNDLENIVVALDVSGSVANSFPELASEVTEIAMARTSRTLSVVPFASTVVDPFQMEDGDIPDAEDFAKVRTGGGSEAIDQVIDWVNENTEGEINVAVIVTDGHLTYGPGPAPEWEDSVIWLIFDNPNFQCDWGRIIHADGHPGYWS